MMGATVAVVAAAAAARAEQDLIERFRVSDATAPDRAQSLNKMGMEGSQVLDRLQAAGVICQAPASSGRYYLDEVAYAAYRRRRQRNPVLAMVVVGIGLMAIALGIVIFMMSSPPR
jgi:hypothetical protein